MPKAKAAALFGGILPHLEELRPQLDNFRQAHSQATQTNTELGKAVADHSENLKILALPLADLKKALPAPSSEPSESISRILFAYNKYISDLQTGPECMGLFNNCAINFGSNRKLYTDWMIQSRPVGFPTSPPKLLNSVLLNGLRFKPNLLACLNHDFSLRIQETEFQIRVYLIRLLFRQSLWN